MLIAVGVVALLSSLGGLYVEGTTGRRVFEVEEFLAIFRGEIHREFFIVSSMLLGIILLVAGFAGWRSNRQLARIRS